MAPPIKAPPIGRSANCTFPQDCSSLQEDCAYFTTEDCFEHLKRVTRFVLISRISNKGLPNWTRQSQFYKYFRRFLFAIYIAYVTDIMPIDMMPSIPLALWVNSNKKDKCVRRVQIKWQRWTCRFSGLWSETKRLWMLWSLKPEAFEAFEARTKQTRRATG